MHKVYASRSSIVHISRRGIMQPRACATLKWQKVDKPFAFSNEDKGELEENEIVLEDDC